MRILFQGDSITDAGRARDNDINLGRGYANLVKTYFNYTRPLEHEFFNRGVGGNKIVDLYARIRCDAVNIAPDFMSVLVGINDIWQEYDFGCNNGVPAKKFGKIYSLIVEEMLEAHPNVKILLMEPFVLRGAAMMGNIADGRDKYEVFRDEVLQRAEETRAVARKYSLGFLPLLDAFDNAAEKTGASYWSADGVHPSEAGHALIADLWIKKFDEMTK